MRIGLITHSLNEGQSKEIYYLAKYLKKIGDDPYVFVLSPTSPHSFVYNEFVKSGIQSQIVPVFPDYSPLNHKIPGHPFITLNEAFAIFYQKLNRLSLLFKKYNIEVAFISTSFVPVKPFLDSTIPYVYHFHDPIENFAVKLTRNFKGRIISHQEALLRNAETITLTSGFHLNYIKKYSGDNYKITYYGCLPAEKRQTRKNRITFLKRFDKTHFKGMATIINSMPKHKFTIAGSFVSSEEKENFLKLITGNNIQIFTNLSEDSMYAILDESLLHIGTYVENFGIYSLEGACRGSIPILPRGIGSLEIFKDMESCLEYPQGNINRLHDLINELLKDENLIHKLQLNAYNVAAKYTWEKYAQTIRQILANR